VWGAACTAPCHLTHGVCLVCACHTGCCMGVQYMRVLGVPSWVDQWSLGSYRLQPGTTLCVYVVQWALLLPCAGHPLLLMAHVHTEAREGQRVQQGSAGECCAPVCWMSYQHLQPAVGLLCVHGPCLVGGCASQSSRFLASMDTLVQPACTCRRLLRRHTGTCICVCT
jgi:hypothetical protein